MSARKSAPWLKVSTGNTVLNRGGRVYSVGQLSSGWYVELWRDGHVRDAETIRGHATRKDAYADAESHEQLVGQLTGTYQLSELAAWSVLRRSRELGELVIEPDGWQLRLAYAKGEGWKLTELRHGECCDECKGEGR